jgi:triacylglycerol lipase
MVGQEGAGAMNPLVLRIRKLRRELEYLRGYLPLDRRGNEIIRKTDFTRCQRPVLLLYGFFATRRVLEVLERRLRRDGYCAWSINLGGLGGTFNTRGIDELAELVREKVDRLYARYELGPMSIIGHSKGGLIGRYYVKRLGGDRRVKNLITLASPHNGSPTAYLGCATIGLMAKDVWQMTPMSPFIRRLKIGAFPRHVRFTSIYSKADRVSPFPSCILEDQGTENLTNVELPAVTHREFLMRRPVYEVIRRELALGYGDVQGLPRLGAVPHR